MSRGSSTQPLLRVNGVMSSKVGFSLGGGVGKKRKLESAVVRSSGGEQEGEGSPKRDAVVAVSAGGVESTATDDCGPLVIPLAQDPWQSVRAAADAEELADKRQRSEDELAADALLADLHGAETGAKRTMVIAGEVGEAAAASAEQATREAREQGTGCGAGAEEQSGQQQQQQQQQQKKKKPLLLSARAPGVENCANDDEKFRHELALRPQELDTKSEAYDRVAIRDFGAALLRGMGWDGAETDLPAQSLPRHHRLGLGAAPKDPAAGGEAPPKRRRKAGDAALEKEEEARRADIAASLVRQKARLQAEHRRSHKLLVGDVVHVGDGGGSDTSAAAGKRARVVRADGVPGLSNVEVRLEGSAGAELLVLKRARLALCDKAELERSPFRDNHQGPRGSGDGGQGTDADEALTGGSGFDLHMGSSAGTAFFGKNRAKDRHRDQGEVRDRRDHDCEQAPGRDRNRDRDCDRDGGKRSSGSSKSSSAAPSPAPRGWLRPDIRVRLVSKKYCGAREYAKKGVVLEMAGRNVCTLRMDESRRTIDGVCERHLESALPKVGGRIAVLMGKARGTTGTLIERSSSKQKATVQMANDLSIASFSLDDVAEFVGRTSDD